MIDYPNSRSKREVENMCICGNRPCTCPRCGVCGNVTCTCPTRKASR